MVLPVVRIQPDDFRVEAELEKTTSENSDVGAVVTFTGVCRGEEGALSALELEHYPGMAEAEILNIAKDAIERFSLAGLTVIHRYGKIHPGENIVLVVAAARHRQAAFDGANYLMDYLKIAAPLWAAGRPRGLAPRSGPHRGPRRRAHP